MDKGMNFFYILSGPLGYVMEWIYKLLPNSFRQLQREGSLSEGAGTAQAVTEGVSSHFFFFL